jgi:hypothetical protein
MQLEMRRILDESPVEYEGTIDGRPFYFRAHHDWWFFGVANTVDEASVADLLPATAHAFLRRAKWGDGPYAASRMPFEGAERVNRARAEEYVQTAGRDAMP